MNLGASGGRIFGMLTMGTYNVMVTVTDFGDPPAQTSANYAITINNPPPQEIALPLRKGQR